MYVKTNWQDLPNTTTPINATNLNKMEQGIYDANDKNAITVNLSQDFTTTTTSATKLPLNTIRTQVGSKLTLQNNSVVIGAGVNHVLVSAQIMIKAHTTDELRRLSIYKNTGDYVRVMRRIVYNYETLAIASVAMPVSQGNTISLYTENAGTSTTINASAVDTYLTVEVID